MRIAFLSFDFGEYSVRHANALLQHGPVLLLLDEQLRGDHSKLIGSQVDYRPFRKPRLRQPLRQLATIRWILRQLKDFRPDVVHFQLGHLWFNFALPILNRRYPLVLTIHNPRHHLGDEGSKTPQWVMDFGYKRADQVIVHGVHLKKVVESEIGIVPERVHVVPHIAIGQDAAKEVESCPNEQEPKILFFGRIWQYKGLDFLIQSQPAISRQFPNAKIVIGGQGEDFQKYTDMMVDPSKFIIHNRWITDEERAEMFEASSVVVLPYIEATQSGVIPMAYNHRKPVIATRTGGLPDFVKDGETGLLIEPGNADAIAKAVIQLLEDDELRHSMGNAGKRMLDEESGPAAVAEETTRVYQLAIQSYAS